MKMLLAKNVTDGLQLLSLKLGRRGYHKTIERELPIFLNLLKVTAQTGLSLPQSLKSLNQSSDIQCPHLAETFATIIANTNANNVSIYDSLLEASQAAKVDLLANLMIALALKTETTDELIAILDAQLKNANSLHEDKCLRLSKNRWRRWGPHVLFFLIFALPFPVLILIGPVFCTLDCQLGPLMETQK